MSQADRPTAPDSIPNYIVDGIDRQGSDVLDEISNYARQLADYKRRPSPDVLEEKIDDVKAASWDSENGRYVYKKMVRCGKDTCHCMSGGEKHGPYLYAYFYDDRGNLTSKYLGLPGEADTGDASPKLVES